MSGMSATVLLAVNRTTPSDVLRTQEMERIQGGRVLTVSEHPVLDRGEHLNVNFKGQRGWRKVVAAARGLVLEHTTVDVILDHWFLPEIYWKNRYNTDWCSHKIPTLLEAGVNRVIVPRNAGMLAMETREDALVQGDPTDGRTNQLWVATENLGQILDRGDNFTHTRRLDPVAPFMVYANTFKVLAGKYNNNSEDSINCYQIWWLGNVVTWEPLSSLEPLDKTFVDKMHRNPGVRIKFTGARSGVHEQLCDPSTVLVVNRFTDLDPLFVAHQKHGSRCALNSVANAMHVPPNEYDTLYTEDPPLEAVVARLRKRKIATFTKVKVEDVHLLAWLLQCKSGTYTVETDAHCLTWDCSNQLLLDTDPAFPYPLPLTPASLSMLGIRHLDKAYQVLPPLRAKRPRRHKGIIPFW